MVRGMETLLAVFSQKSERNELGIIKLNLGGASFGERNEQNKHEN